MRPLRHRPQYVQHESNIPPSQLLQQDSHIPPTQFVQQESNIHSQHQQISPVERTQQETIQTRPSNNTIAIDANTNIEEYSNDTSSTESFESGQTGFDNNHGLPGRLSKKFKEFRNRNEGITIGEYFSECLNLVETPDVNNAASIITFKHMLFQKLGETVPKDILEKKYKF